jgi:hypothetical protein
VAHENCVCGQRTGRICPVHPNRPLEFRSMHPIGEPGERVPYAADDVPIEVLDDEWEQAVALAEGVRATEATSEAALQTGNDRLAEAIGQRINDVRSNPDRTHASDVPRTIYELDLVPRG